MESFVYFACSLCLFTLFVYFAFVFPLQGEEQQEPLEGEAIVFSAKPEELEEEEEEILEALELPEDEGTLLR